jgi:hypothetical protein
LSSKEQFHLLKSTLQSLQSLSLIKVFHLLGTKTNKIAKMHKVDEHATKNSKKVGGLLSFSMFNAKIK